MSDVCLLYHDCLCFYSHYECASKGILTEQKKTGFGFITAEMPIAVALMQSASTRAFIFYQVSVAHKLEFRRAYPAHVLEFS